MQKPILNRVLLRNIASKIPSNSWITERLADTDRLDQEMVLYVRGDLDLSVLDLDHPLALGSPLRAMLADVDDTPTSIFMILIEGALHVKTTVTNENTDGATHLIVLGSMSAHDIAIGGQYFDVGGALTAHNLLWGHYNHGSLRVSGLTSARVAVFSDEYDVALAGGEQFRYLLDEVRGVPSLMEFSLESIAGIFVPKLLHSAEGGNDWVGSVLDRDAAVVALRAGETISFDDAAIDAFMPVANDVFADESISIANVLACVNAGLIEGDATDATGWYAQTEFVVGKRRIDEDGDQRDDRVYITVWKQYDFYFGVAHEASPEPQGLGARLKSVLMNRPQALVEALQLQCRTYTDGAPNDWAALDDETALEVRAAATAAWRGVLDYMRKAIGQLRAGYPLALRTQSALSQARVTALIGLPVFVEEYNDFWTDNAGLWNGEVCVRARQSCQHNGHDYTRAFKLSFENGDDAPGDEEGDAHATYFYEEIVIAGEPPTITLEYEQRQSRTLVTIPRTAADHHARALRMFEHIERRLTDAERTKAEARAKRQRLIETVTLLKAPPYSENVLDRAIFPRELMALSEQWQTQGRAFSQAIRAIHAEHEAKPDDMPDEDNDDFVWPTDPRKETWATAMQLARVVSAHASPDLSARFRNLFSFAPSGMHEGAGKHGQFIGPLFLLDDGRVATRVGPVYDQHAYWVLLDGLSCTRMATLSGLGRSPNRQCYASCEDGILITRNGFQGSEIARFALPTGVEGLPSTLKRVASAHGARCDELIPFNDGQRVLVLNATGIYSVDKEGVQRLHPKDFDDDGPYTWPKNNEDDDLDLSMVNMALSSDEKFIMVGDQDSEHVLLTADGSYVRGLDPVASYPHHCLFSFDGTHVMANSCHLYSGYTSITHVESADEPRDFEQSWRVYASIAAPDFVILGNAEGYIHAVDYSGKILWRHHIGSTISSVDISTDGNTVIVASYGGYLVRLEKQSTTPDPFAIGTSSFTEVSRWIFWKDEPSPIYW